MIRRLRTFLRNWLGVEELQAKQEETTKEIKLARSRPLTMADRCRQLERRSYAEAIQRGSPYAKNIPPGVRAPQ